jgi:cysteine desulfurase
MERIYLDHASAKPIDKRVFNYTVEFLSEKFGNPSSQYTLGLESKEAIENSRQKIARFINAEKENSIIFTSNSTEANNIAIRGTASRNINIGKEVAASAIEHISVLNPMKYLQKNGFKFSIIPVDSQGTINIGQLKKLINKNTSITSIMYANNEIGTIEPIKEISDIVHEKGNYLHVDATAAGGLIPIDVQKDDIDLLTLSSNSIYGPVGAAILYIKPGLKIQSILPGGGQERGIRSGTENVFAIAGMGEAVNIISKEMREENKRLKGLRDKLINDILKIDESYLTGHPTERLPNHASFRFSYIEGESILLNMNLNNIQIATGSACSSRTLEPSHVLLAIGLKHEEAHGSMIISLGQSNNKDQIPIIVDAVHETVERLREMSPLGRKK